jgi:hypothetical protein
MRHSLQRVSFKVKKQHGNIPSTLAERLWEPSTVKRWPISVHHGSSNAHWVGRRLATTYKYANFRHAVESQLLLHRGSLSGAQTAIVRLVAANRQPIYGRPAGSQLSGCRRKEDRPTRSHPAAEANLPRPEFRRHSSNAGSCAVPPPGVENGFGESKP